MANPSKVQARRRQFVSPISTAFIELGYRGTTTAELAERCDVRENVLYRIWPNKKAMFLDAVEYVYTATMQAWEKVKHDQALGKTVAERILNNQADYHGKLRLYRILFAGLSEDDPEIKSALRDVYRRFHEFITRVIDEHRRYHGQRGGPDAALSAWTMVGMGAVLDIQRELEIVPVNERRMLMKQIGGMIIDGKR